MRARRPRPKLHITLNEAFEIDENLDVIFNNEYTDQIFDFEVITLQEMFEIFLYEYGDRYINHNFTVRNGEIVTDGLVLKLTSLIRLFTYKNFYKYKNLKDSENFEYNPLDNTDIEEVKDQTRTPNLTGSETITDTGSKTTALNNTDTRTTDMSEIYNNLKDKTDYGKSTDTSDRVDYHSTTTTNDDIMYGKVDTNVTSGNVTTDAVVPYDQAETFSSTTRSTDNPTVTDTLSGSDQRDISEAKTGYDTRTIDEDTSGSDSTTRTGNIRNAGSIVDAHTGTITEQRGGGQTKSSSATGTEDLDATVTRTGFQPQYSISSRQDMVRKFREISDFSALSTYLRDVADYILLGTYLV